jgi:hypothetical protein
LFLIFDFFFLSSFQGISALSKSKWKGGVLRIEIAKPNFEARSFLSSLFFNFSLIFLCLSCFPHRLQKTREEEQELLLKKSQNEELHEGSVLHLKKPWKGKKITFDGEDHSKDIDFSKLWEQIPEKRKRQIEEDTTRSVLEEKKEMEPISETQKPPVSLEMDDLEFPQDGPSLLFDEEIPNDSILEKTVSMSDSTDPWSSIFKAAPSNFFLFGDSSSILPPEVSTPFTTHEPILGEPNEPQKQQKKRKIEPPAPEIVKVDEEELQAPLTTQERIFHFIQQHHKDWKLVFFPCFLSFIFGDKKKKKKLNKIISAQAIE